MQPDLENCGDKLISVISRVFIKSPAAATARSHHAGRGALVFRFEIALNQLLEEELIGFECLEHKEIS